MNAYTSIPDVQAALGPSVAFSADPYAQACVDAANDVCTQKRAANGYDDVDPFPPAVVQGATLYAVALWRERASVESFASFTELDGAVTVGGSWGQIKRLLGIPRAHAETPMSFADAAARRRALLYPPAVSP